MPDNENEQALNPMVEHYLDKTGFGYFWSQLDVKFRGIQTALNGKANASHTHTKSQITDFGSYLPLTGGTLTGNITFADSTIDRDAEANTSAQIGKAAVFNDKDGERIGVVRTDRDTNGIMRTRIGVFTENSSNDEVNNWFMLSVDRSGTRYYSVSDASKFRSDLGITPVNIGAAPASHTHDVLSNLYASRSASADIDYGDGGFRYFLATSSMTTGKPPEDSHIIHMDWDNSGNWAGQLAIGTSNAKVWVRSHKGGAWSNWFELSRSGHTHNVGEITWAGSQNLTTTATANGQEWSIDMTPGSYTGTCWQVWSSKNSKTVLACYADDNSVRIPNGNLIMGGGAINFNSRGSNSIYNGPNDAANGAGGALNNLVFSSWYGVSFTTSCTGQTYTGKNAVSINCRSGYLYANYLNQSSGAETPSTSSYIMYCNSDGFLRKSTPANIRSIIGAQAAGSYLSLTGGTMSSTLNINGTMNTHITFKRTNQSFRLNARPSAAVYACGITAYDSNGDDIFYTQNALMTDGKAYRSFIACRHSSDGKTTYYNGFYLDIDTSGNTAVRLTGNGIGAAWRQAIGAAASSDRRLKSDIEPLGDDAVEFVRSLKPCVYTINNERQVGLIAQDVHESDKWGTRMTYETREGYDGLDEWERMPDGSPTWKLDYIRLIAPLTAALQDAMKRIDELESRIEELESVAS